MNEFMDQIMALDDPYSLRKDEKLEIYRKALSELTRHHYAGCKEYARILDGIKYDASQDQEALAQPMIPVRLFKDLELISVNREQIVKTMTSSGTSGQKVSKIYLDKENTLAQTKALTKIISSYIGNTRLPLLILDTRLALKDRAMFSARGAGIVGFLTFGRDVTYALDEDMSINLTRIEAFLKKHRGEKILMFGYTYMIWQYVISAMKKLGQSLPVESGIMFHIGGWKKLKDQAVDEDTFNAAIKAVLGNVSVHNYYGMAEQLGSVFVECEYGHMHCSAFSDIMIRRASDFSCADFGETGLIELISLLPTSYPGHILLTEDEGVILGEDDCPCGRKGKYFKISGRVKDAEIRGCSDTFEARN